MKKIILLGILLAGIYPGIGYWAGYAQNAREFRTENIGSQEMTVTVDADFPRAIEYRLGGKLFRGAMSPERQVMVNGKPQPARIVFRKEGENRVVYDFTFDKIELSFSVELVVRGKVLEGRVNRIKEGQDKLYTLAFPGQQLLTVAMTDKAPAYIWCRMIPMKDAPDVYQTLRESSPDGSARTANYLFLENGELAAGILSNVIDERERVAFQVKQIAGNKVCQAWCPVWTYRELATETLEMPWFKVVIADDGNRDGIVDWQDAALLYRAEVKRPFRSEEVKTIVSSQIGFNASHLAENPFLRMFDNMKKCALLLDFLPQDLLVKGFQGGGHDSSFPDYAHPNRQAGGFRDLNYMIDHGEEIGLKVGLHINCTEAYPESRYFDPSILTKELGWLWGDQAILIDKKKDLKSGKLFQRMDEMFDSVPNIDFLYVDTYQDRGWPLIKINEKLVAHRQRMYTEFDAAMDGVSTWSHGRTRLKGKVARFIWNDCRDIFGPDPLLLGAEHHGINGWEGEASVPRFVKEVYTRNLPTKFLQHFRLMRWTEQEAVFDGGVKMERQGNRVKGVWGNSTFFSGLWDEQRKSFKEIKVFVPWEPLTEQAGRIFAWDETGGRGHWVLPDSWKKIKKVYVYRLTDRGRVFERAVPVNGRAVDYTFEKETPYVFYARKVQEIDPAVMKWGDGQEVGDPGFNDYTLSSWEKTGDKRAVRVERDRNGQTSLQLAAGKVAGVSQRIGALQPGAAYFVSTRVLIDGKADRRTGLQVEALQKGKVVHTVKNYLDNTALNGTTGWQRLRVWFEVPAGTDDVRIGIRSEAGTAGTVVWVDDVKAYRTTPVAKEADYVLWEDFELRDIGWGPFVNTVKGSIYTDLSEFNPGRTADVIDGHFSLKTWNQKKGLLYRTVPGLLRLSPEQKYEIEFDYLCDRDNSYELIIKESDRPEARVLLREPIERGKGRMKKKFSTTRYPDAWIGIEKTNNDPVIFVMDNLKLFIR